jgi:diacylglycerol O-acyltransferase
MNGARAERFFAVAPIFDGTALVFGVFSYRGNIELTFVSCRRVVPDPTFLAECVQSAYDEMLSALAPTPTARTSSSRTAKAKAATAT